VIRRATVTLPSSVVAADIEPRGVDWRLHTISGHASFPVAGADSICMVHVRIVIGGVAVVWQTSTPAFTCTNGEPAICRFTFGDVDPAVAMEEDTPGTQRVFMAQASLPEFCLIPQNGAVEIFTTQFPDSLLASFSGLVYWQEEIGEPYRR